MSQTDKDTDTILREDPSATEPCDIVLPSAVEETSPALGVPRHRFGALEPIVRDEEGTVDPVVRTKKKRGTKTEVGDAEIIVHQGKEKSGTDDLPPSSSELQVKNDLAVRNKLKRRVKTESEDADIIVHQPEDDERPPSCFMKSGETDDDNNLSMSNSADQTKVRDKVNYKVLEDGVNEIADNEDLDVDSRDKTIDEEDADDDDEENDTLGYEVRDSLTFYEAMWPLILAMKMFGLWHSNNVIDPQSRKQNTDAKRGILKTIFCLRTYCIFVILVLWLNVFRYVPAFFYGPPNAMLEEKLFAKVIYVAFLLQCAGNATVMFYATSKLDKLPKFFHHWEGRIQTSEENRVDLAFVRRRSVVFTVLAVIYIIFHLIYRSYCIFGPNEWMNNSTVVFVAPFPDSLSIHACFLVVDVFECASWVYSIFFYILICLVIRNQFQLFDKRLDKAVIIAYEKNGGMPENFEELRCQHQELCVAVNHSNGGLFTYINVIAYGTMLPLVCFLLHQLLFSQTYADDISDIMMYVIWLISIFINVPLVSWTAAIVNTRAHAPLNKTYNISVNNATSEELLMLNMFMSRLNGIAVGYTIFDLVTITKPFILTIAGLGVTYFALLAEFQ
ncbi:uncharacterized protein LOC144437000 [Glandiceps talaboti]